MPRLLALAMLAFALLAAPVAAQTPVQRADFPAVDFDRLNSGDAVPGQPDAVFIHTGQGWAIASRTPAPLPPTVDPCNPRPDPYTEPERAVRCAIQTRLAAPPPPALTEYMVGATYRHPYPSIRMLVLSVSTSLEGVPVVTGQFIGGPHLGEVFAFRANVAQPWFRD
jgi:hypothetical protein